MVLKYCKFFYFIHNVSMIPFIIHSTWKELSFLFFRRTTKIHKFQAQENVYCIHTIKIDTQNDSFRKNLDQTLISRLFSHKKRNLHCFEVWFLLKTFFVKVNLRCSTGLINCCFVSYVNYDWQMSKSLQGAAQLLEWSFGDLSKCAKLSSHFTSFEAVKILKVLLLASCIPFSTFLEFLWHFCGREAKLLDRVLFTKFFHCINNQDTKQLSFKIYTCKTHALLTRKY